MDLQVVLIGAVVFVVSSVFIYLISAFTMRTKSFEEEIAEQRKRMQEEQEKAKKEKKLVDKKKKKTKDKTKEKPSHIQVSEPELQKEHKMVNLELEPEVIEPLDMPSPESKSKSKKKAAKPILINKEEKTLVTASPKEFKHDITPKDDLELKHEHDRQAKKSASKEPKGTKKDKQEKGKPEDPVAVIEEQIIRKETSKVENASPTAEGRTDTKSRSGDVAVSNKTSKLVSSVKSATLSDWEVQSLIDILLDKQGSSGAALSTEWSKKSQKGDPVALLRKQLEEKERALQEEQQLAMTASMKLKEVRNEISQEKIRFGSIEKNYKEKVDYQAQEIQALHSRMQQTHEQHMIETSQMRARVEAQAGEQSHMQRLAEENKMLRDSLAKSQSETVSASEVNNMKQKVLIMEKELSSNVVKLNSSENSKKALEQKVGQYEAQLKKLESHQKSSDSVLDKRVDDVSSELRKSEARNTALDKELQAAKKAVDVAHNDVGSLKTQLQALQKSLSESDSSFKETENKLKESERLKHEMEGNVKNLEKKLAAADKRSSDVEAQKQDVEKVKSSFENKIKNLEQKLTETERKNSDITTELKSLQQENEAFSIELKTTRERQAGEGQEAPAGAPNGDVHSTEDSESSKKITLIEHEKILSEKVTEISKLRTELGSKKSDLSKLQEEVESQKKKNNDLREKNWKAMDALEKSEKSLSEKVQSAIISTKDEVSNTMSETEKYDKSIMQKLFPEVSVKESSKSHKDWMFQFEKQATAYLSSSNTDISAKFESQIKSMESRTRELEAQLEQQTVAREAEGNMQSKVSELEDSNSKLQSQVQHYRSVLADTENQLKQLENSVESEETKWQERLKIKDAEVEEIKQEGVSLREQLLRSQGSTEMKVKVETLESQLKASGDRCVQLQEQVENYELKIQTLETTLSETEKSSSDIPNLQKELDDLRRLLEEERKKNKELAGNAVKLNGIIKTGHDALAQEQNLVKELKKQLEEKMNGSLPVGSSTEAAKLKAKLEEAEKHLEIEKSNNKALSQKLTASQSSLNEAGTSV